MFIITHRKIFFALSAIIVGLSIAAISVWGLQLGIDFTGGALTEVSYENTRPEKASIESRLSNLPIGAFSLRPSGEQNYILRTRDLTDAERQAVEDVLVGDEAAGGAIERFNSIGPAIGAEIQNKALVALSLVVVAIIVFVAFAFRHVSEPVSSWKYGLIAIVALLHDIIVPTALFAFLGQFFGAEVGVLFVMALLAILGYSVNDTIVVFDRVRENLRRNAETGKREDFELTVGKSLHQTFTRSINTSITTIFVLLALFFLGGEPTQDFALVLLAGVLAGAYSSLFLAAPLLVTIERLGRKRK